MANRVSDVEAFKKESDKALNFTHEKEEIISEKEE
jgi:hypothetical protein